MERTLATLNKNISITGRPHTLSCVFIFLFFSFRFLILEVLKIFKLHFIRMMIMCKYLCCTVHRIMFFLQCRSFYREEASQNFHPKSGLVESCKVLWTNCIIKFTCKFRAAEEIHLEIISKLQIIYSSPSLFLHSSRYKNPLRAKIL